jgi:hypothetical protein
MTILVGILCDEGIVIGSDGMASLGDVGSFVGLGNIKTHVVLNKLIVSCAGRDDLMTEFINFLNLNYYKFIIESEYSEDVFYLANKIGQEFARYMVDAIKLLPSELNAKLLQEITENGFTFGALIALVFKNKHYLISYDNRLRPNLLRENGIWHKIIGTGYVVAEPSVHLVKKLLNIHSKPNLNRAQLLSYWTIAHAIEVSSGGIGGVISIFTLGKQPDGSYRISEDKTSEYKSAIEDMYKHIWNYEKSDSSEEVQKIPELTDV